MAKEDHLILISSMPLQMGEMQEDNLHYVCGQPDLLEAEHIKEQILKHVKDLI